MSNPRYGSGRKQFVGQGIEADLGKLDPAAYQGAVAYSDGELYYSDGSEWLVPQDEVDISRPRNLAPTNAVEQAQLRLSAFRSPTGESQTGIIFEINTDGLPNFGEGANLITRTVTSEVASSYSISYPDDGFQPGETIWWRARYLGTNGTQSQYSIPTAQTFPDLITTPSPVTVSNAITGTVTLTPYESAPVFGLEYYQTQVEFYAIGAVVGVDTPITTVTQTGGAVTTAPIPPLVAGQSYQWRGRYTGRTGVGAAVVTSGWSAARPIFLGSASIVLVYNLNLAAARTVYIPLGAQPTGEPYSIVINWGDGISETFTSSGIKSHTYAGGFTPTGGLVTVTISGRLTLYGGQNVIDQSGLVRVENIGFSMGLVSLDRAFRNTTVALEYVTPNLPETITSLTSMFAFSTSNPASLADLDTRNITNLSRMFQSNTVFNRPIGGWDVSKVVDFSFLFSATIFNQPIGTWNTGSATTMQNMFNSATAFNQNLGAWDVSKVTNFQNMFSTTPFNNGGSSSINNWNTSSLVLADSMFLLAAQFNQPIGTWNVSNAVSMSSMFQNATAFNQNIGAWNTGNVTGMSAMFQTASFNNGGSPSIGNWDTSKVTNMAYMFYLNNGFNQPIGTWNTSSVTTTNNMFAQANSFDQNIGAWNTTNVTIMSAMFANNTQFNNGGSPDIGNWNTTKVTTMEAMFNGCPKFNQNIGAWNVGNVTNMTSMFNSATAFNNGGSSSINNWNTSKVTTMVLMLTTASSFNQPIGNWDVSSVSNMSTILAGTGLNQSLADWNLRLDGVNLTGFSGGVMNTENYSRTLIGWANDIASRDGPYVLTPQLSGGKTYNSSVYVPGARFTNAVAARAFLVGGRVVSVTGSSDTNANTTYTYNGTTQTYDASNGWKFAVLGTSWALYNASAVLQATGTGTVVGTGPHTATSWTGVLSAATVLRTGAGWTITGDAAA